MLTPTGATTTEYITALMNGSKTTVKLTAIGQTYGEQDDPIVFTDDDIESAGLTLSSVLNGDEDLTMGRAVMDELNVALLRSEKTEKVVWSGDFKLEMGVKIDDDINFVTVGYYIGKRPDRFIQDDVIQFRLVDRMSLFEKPSDDYLNTLTIDEDHPITISDLYHGLCTYCGVTYDSGDELSNIMSRSYTALPFDNNGVLCRDIIAYIAEACGCYARINSSGHIVMTWFHDHMDDYMVERNYEFDIHISEVDFITNNNLKKTWADLEGFTWEQLSDYLWGELEGMERPFKIHALNVRQMEDDSGVLIPPSADRNIYLIVDNPFLKTANSTEETDYLVPIYNRLIAFDTYIPSTVECVGNWLVEPGDVISVETTAGSHIRMPIFVRQLHWNGSCTDVYEVTGNIERETVSPYNNTKMVQGGRMHIVRQTVDESYERIQDELGNYSTQQQTAQAISLAVASKPDIIYSTTQPSTTGLAEGTIWVDTSVISGTSTPQNIWKKWNGTTWEDVTDNTVYERQSGIVIDANGVSITGSKQVSITSGGSLDVDATNFKIDSTNKYVKTGEWKLEPRGLTADLYYSSTNYMLVFGRTGIVYPTDKPLIGILPSISGYVGSKYSGSFQLTMIQSGATENAGLNIDIMTGLNPPRVAISTSLISGGSSVALLGMLGSLTKKWRVYGENVYYDSLIQNSSRDVKHNIKEMHSLGEKLDKLTPVTFVYNYDSDEKERTGLIYEDTIEIMPEICTQDESNKAISYVELIPALLKEIQDLRKRVAELERG